MGWERDSRAKRGQTQLLPPPTTRLNRVEPRRPSPAGAAEPTTEMAEGGPEPSLVGADCTRAKALRSIASFRFHFVVCSQ